MTFEETFLKIGRIVFLARLKATGTPEDLAQMLCIDRSTLYRIINKATRIGVRLEYSKDLKSFILLPSGLQEVSRDDLKLIKGDGDCEKEEKKGGCILF